METTGVIEYIWGLDMSALSPFLVPIPKAYAKP